MAKLADSSMGAEMRRELNEPVDDGGLWLTAMALTSLLACSVGYYIGIWPAIALWCVLTIILLKLMPR